MEQTGPQKQETSNQTIIIQQTPVAKSNGLGTAGFVLALLGMIFCWVPGLGVILWLLGLILSFCAIFKQPRGLAIAGLVISFIDLIILITVLGSIAAMLS